MEKATTEEMIFEDIVITKDELLHLLLKREIKRMLKEDEEIRGYLIEALKELDHERKNNKK